MLDWIERIARIVCFVGCVIYFAQAGLCVWFLSTGALEYPFWLLPLLLAVAFVAAGIHFLRLALYGSIRDDASPSPTIGTTTLPTFSASGAVRYGIVAALIIESFIFREAHYEDHPKDLLTAWTPCLLIFGALAFMSDRSWAIIKAPPAAIGRALRSWLRQ
jgi:hypothetical protein